MRQRLFPGDHPQVATCLGNVAACLEAPGRVAEALSAADRAAGMTNRILPEGHRDRIRIAKLLERIRAAAQDSGK